MSPTTSLFWTRLRASGADVDRSPQNAISMLDSSQKHSFRTPFAISSVNNYGDRFVPNPGLRKSYHLMDDGQSSTPHKNKPSEPDTLNEDANALFTSILHTEVSPPTSSIASRSGLPLLTPPRPRFFTYHPPSYLATPTRRLDNPTDEAYGMTPLHAQSIGLLESPRRQPRRVCKTMDRILDAPDLADDFYLNLVDWSSTNVVGVGLGSSVYLWAAHNAAVSKLCDLGPSDTVSSVSWVQSGTTLAVGTVAGRLDIYDANTLQLQRTYQQAHTKRIGALAWNTHVLSSGSRDRSVHHRDVREASTRPFKRCTGHRQEVCGLKWGAGSGASATYLASGGNDNNVCIWDIRGLMRPGASSPHAVGSGSGDDGTGDKPLWKFREHTAAVKALAWDPHVSGVLATGGGEQDGHIRFWNVLNGSMLHELDTRSQVSNLIWSLTSHEIVSAHGFSSTTAHNQICIWKYPKFNKVASLTGHRNRVLYLAMSPDGETIVSGAGDETLRFWNAFPKTEKNERERESKLDYGRLIR